MPYITTNQLVVPRSRNHHGSFKKLLYCMQNAYISIALLDNTHPNVIKRTVL